MKIRNGFVSNSSSSSFLVLFPKKISTYDELFDLMWTNENEKSIQRQWKFNTAQGYSNIRETFTEFQKWATNTVLKSIKSQNENNYLRAISLISSSDGWYDEEKNEYNHNDEIITSIEDIKKHINKKTKIDDVLSNFDWSVFSDDYYDELSELSGEYDWIQGIEESLDEIEDAINSNKNKTFYTFAYSDEDGTHFSIMEHGGIFGDLPTYVESFH